MTLSSHLVLNVPRLDRHAQMTRILADLACFSLPRAVDVQPVNKDNRGGFESRGCSDDSPGQDYRLVVIEHRLGR